MAVRVHRRIGLIIPDAPILLAFVFGRSTRQRMEGLAASVPLAVAGFGAFVVAGFGGWGVLQAAAPTVGCCTQRYSYLVR
jgi:hypothetical protein